MAHVLHCRKREALDELPRLTKRNPSLYPSGFVLELSELGASLAELAPRPSTPVPSQAACPGSPLAAGTVSSLSSSCTDHWDTATTASNVSSGSSSAETLHGVLHSVPALRTALAALDALRGPAVATKDVASLVMALGLPGSNVLAEELWWELAQCCQAAVPKEASSDASSALDVVRASVAQDPQRRAGILHRAALEDYALSGVELQVLPATLVDHDVWCEEIPAQLTIQERCYRVPDVIYAAYRKWGTLEALEAGRRAAKAVAPARRRERRAELEARLEGEGLSALANTLVCRELIETGMAPVGAVVAELLRSSQWRCRAKALTDRLNAEGLGQYRQEAMRLRHLREPKLWGLEDVVGAIKAHQRRMMLWQRLESLGAPSFIHEPCCQQYIQYGAPSLEDTLRQLSAHTLECPVGARAKAPFVVGWLPAMCTAPQCARRAAAGCLTCCCASHCQDLLCRCRQ